MKHIVVIVLGLLALAAPAAAAAATPVHLSPTQLIIRQEDRGGHVAVGQTGAPTLAERIIAQERARRNDPALLGDGPVSAPVEVVESGGFQWGDAGIGAAVALAAMLVLTGATLVVRNRRPEEA